MNASTKRHESKEQKEQPSQQQQKESLKQTNKRLVVLDSVPVVEVSSDAGNLFDNNTTETVEVESTSKSFLFSEQELRTFSTCKQTIVMIDVEACDAVNGPVLAIGCVVGVYHDYMKYEIVRRDQWIVPRTINDCSSESKKFWHTSGFNAWNYFTTMAQAVKKPTSEHDIAIQFRRYMNECWRCIPQLSIMVDSVHVDLTLLNMLLLKYKLQPLQYDHTNTYRHSLYVCRDLIRGSYAGIDSAYADLHHTGLNKAINETWKRVIGGGKRVHVGGQKGYDVNLYGRQEKHFPVWDALQSLILWFQTEDLRFYYETRCPRVMLNSYVYPQTPVMYVPMASMPVGSVNPNLHFLPSSSSSSSPFSGFSQQTYPHSYFCVEEMQRRNTHKGIVRERDRGVKSNVLQHPPSDDIVLTRHDRST